MTKAKKDELYHSIRDMMRNALHRIHKNPDVLSVICCVLGILLYRYMSEDLVSYINEEGKTENVDFNYMTLPDAEAEKVREKAVKSKGFFISPQDLFWNISKTVSENNKLNATLGVVFQRIEKSVQGSASESSFAGLFDGFDLNSLSLGDTFTQRNENLILIMNGIASLNLGKINHPDIEAFGETSEYLMSYYASVYNKSAGMFRTPDSVSELCVRLGTADKDFVKKVYDPACGFGSLLLKAKTILGNEKVQNGFFGQDINFQIYNLCRMNMILHGLKYDEFSIACGDTLTDPCHWNDEPFDLIVSNPPFYIQWNGEGYSSLIDDPRFAPVGVLPSKSRMDFAFVLHSLSWLTPDGTAVFVCMPKILWETGADQKIRMYLIDHNFIDCIIQLPSALFNCVGTGIPTCIMVLKKDRPDNKILFINAGKFIKVKNKISSRDMPQSPEDIIRVVYAYKARRDKLYFTHLATYDEIVKNDYNLSVSIYVEEEESLEPEEANSHIAMDNKPESYKGEDPYIFVSYSHKNDSIVLDIIKHLQDQGFRVFYDEGIVSGSDWNKYIIDRIKDCDCFCAMFSEEYWASDICQNELTIAVQDYKKPNFGIYLQETQIPPELKLIRGLKQDMFYYEYKDEEKFLVKLYSTEMFKNCLGEPS